MRRWFAIVLAAATMLGCSGADDLEDEPTSFMGEQSDAMIPIMLHNKTIRHSGISHRLQVTDINNVELLEISDKQDDGTMTAHVKFDVGEATPRYHVELKVTSQMTSAKNEDGFDVVTYPVKDINTLAIKRPSP